MQKLLLIAAAFGVSTAPAVAQTTPAPEPAPSQAAPAPQKVTKLVCRNVEEERGIGSRLSSTTKICRKVEVPAPAKGQQAQQQPSRAGSR
jgi:hypothetical protein